MGGAMAWLGTPAFPTPEPAPWAPHLVNVHSRDGPRVALQGEETARVLQAEHLGQEWASSSGPTFSQIPLWPGNPSHSSSETLPASP